LKYCSNAWLIVLDMSPRLRFFSLSCFSFSGVILKFSFWVFVIYGLGMSLISIIFNFLITFLWSCMYECMGVYKFYSLSVVFVICCTGVQFCFC
jgi:membrane protein required for beta-lactamase induction